MSNATLLIKKAGAPVRLVSLSKPLVTIGRGDNNDIPLPDDTRSISRRHAELELMADGTSVLRDLGSSNGTLVNNQRLTKPMVLCANDVITIGPFQLIFQANHLTDAERTRLSKGTPGNAGPPPAPLEIEAAAVDLQELQERSVLIPASETKDVTKKLIEVDVVELLHEVGLKLARTQTVAEVKQTAVELLFKIKGVQRGTLMLSEGEQELSDAEVYTRSETGVRPKQSRSHDPKEFILSNTILKQVRENNRPLHIRDAKFDTVLRKSASIVDAGIQAAFCSPLTFQGRFLGVLYADNLMSPDAFSADDFRTFTTIAAQTGLALANALARSELMRKEVEQAAMRLYLSPQLAGIISASKGSIQLGGVLQQVTVLYADIRGFTHMSEQMDARDVVALLNEVFTVMTEVIYSAGGTLDKYIGDCVMALFGAPIAGPNDVENAVQTAIGMQQALQNLNLRCKQEGLREVRIGVGVHCGQAVVGNIGSAQRMQYTAIGDTVNIAARLVDLAEPGQIIVSEDIRRSLASRTSFQALGEVQLKGREKTLKIYELLWA